MFINNIYSFYLSKLFLGYKKKNLKIVIPKTASGLKFLMQLQRCGVIQFFYTKNNRISRRSRDMCATNEVVVYLKYINGQAPFSYFKNYWALRKKISISYAGCTPPSPHKFKTILLIKTESGILTEEECRQAKIGGLLLCAIYL